MIRTEVPAPLSRVRFPAGPCSPRVSTSRISSLQRHCHGVPAPDAQGREPAVHVSLFHGVQERDHDAISRAADRMAQGYGTPADVEDLPGDAELLSHTDTGHGARGPGGPRPPSSPVIRPPGPGVAPGPLFGAHGPRAGAFSASVGGRRGFPPPAPPVRPTPPPMIPPPIAMWKSL